MLFIGKECEYYICIVLYDSWGIIGKQFTFWEFFLLKVVPLGSIHWHRYMYYFIIILCLSLVGIV